VTAIYSESEIEIAADGADTNVILLIGLAIVTCHHTLHIGRTALVSNRNGYHSLVHSLEPCTPVALTTTWCASTIAVAPAIVVGTYHTILVGTIAGKNYTEVIPVVLEVCKVLDACANGIARRYVEVLRVSTPEGCRVILGTSHHRTQDGYHLR